MRLPGFLLGKQALGSVVWYNPLNSSNFLPFGHFPCSKVDYIFCIMPLLLFTSFLNLLLTLVSVISSESESSDWEGTDPHF